MMRRIRYWWRLYWRNADDWGQRSIAQYHAWKHWRGVIDAEHRDMVDRLDHRV